VPELLASGPYRRVRHPQHLAVFFYCLGFALLFRSWIGLALMAAQAAALVHRIKNEEQELARRHGALWTERVRTSWKLVPYVY
jgi:protein-S-isoprenylcysteine O-methyltransferase Ste14